MHGTLWSLGVAIVVKTFRGSHTCRFDPVRVGQLKPFAVFTHSWSSVILLWWHQQSNKLKRSKLTYLFEIGLIIISFKQDMSRNHSGGFKGTDKYCFLQSAVYTWWPAVWLAVWLGWDGRRDSGDVDEGRWSREEQDISEAFISFSTISGTLVLFLERGISPIHVCSVLFFYTNSIIVNLKRFLTAIFPGTSTVFSDSSKVRSAESIFSG